MLATKKRDGAKVKVPKMGMLRSMLGLMRNGMIFFFNSNFHLNDMIRNGTLE